MEVRRVEGSKLIDNIVYNIYQNEGNVNVGVCLVIGENNRNNRTIIRLRKLIGNDEISLIKSEIYGKNPVNLTGADLTHSNLTGAVLTDTKLNFSKLTGATLIDATLTDANLTGSNLTGANLTGANISFSNLTLSNLTGAILTRVNLYLTDLTDSNLTNANLTGATLTDATLTDAIISRNSLSESQTEEGTIFGQPKYIEDLSEEQLRQEQRRQEQRRQEQRRQEGQLENNNSNGEWNRNRRPQQRRRNSNNNRNILFDGNNLVENCVYNIYQNDGNVNVGVCLVISENNRNNGTRIKLRKLIGNTELSLIKSEIYGKNPVNLRNANLTDAVLTGAVLIGADLTDANLRNANLTGAVLIGVDLIDAYLTGADLTDADLRNANLTGAVLIGVDLIDAYLTGADLTDADLRNANLTGAVLTYADLTDADLTDADLRNANLTDAFLIGADLTGADLNNATIFRDSLSPQQKDQIIGQLNYIEREIQRPPRQQREKPIEIPENLLNPVKNSNNSCPNFNGLYKFIMSQNLSGMFSFKYKGSNHKVIDYGGPKRDVFDKILPAYTKNFFVIIKDNEDYVILKEDVDMDTLIRETEQLILLASASETKIFLKIDPILLSLLKGNQFKYFNNNKRNSFSNLYKKFNQYIEHSNNNSQLLRNKNNSKLIETLKSENLKNEVLVKTLKQEIRFRRFAITRGFTNMEQFNKMAQFIRKFYYVKKCFITCKLKFDVESFVKRIKLYKKIYRNPVDYYLEPIPLEQYVRLSQNNESILILNRADDIIMNYPYLIPFLNFIFGPESSDDDRKLFVRYISGTSSYTGELKIYLSSLTHVKAGRPYNATTCGKYLEIFRNKRQNRHSITVDAIRTQLLSDTGFGLA